MKSIILLALMALAINSKPADVSKSSDISVKSQWEEYKLKYSKSYSFAEEKTRFIIFSDNLATILQHNSEEALGLRTFKLGINEFSDMDFHEMSKLMGGHRRPDGLARTGAKYLSPMGLGAAPASIDWRSTGCVTPVKNQSKKCGSCYAFSATGSLEGQNFRLTKKLTSLSEQNLVDCSTKYGNNGCNGGRAEYCFRYIRDNKGIDTEISYPYEGIDTKKCRFEKANVGARLTSWLDTPQGDEVKLRDIVASVGPISISIDANHTSFAKYISGVYLEPACSTDVNHAMLIVGYGTQSGQDYWLVKNSWGTSWGEQGYVKMARNRNNQCGIASDAFYPLL